MAILACTAGETKFLPSSHQMDSRGLMLFPTAFFEKTLDLSLGNSMTDRPQSQRIGFQGTSGNCQLGWRCVFFGIQQLSTLTGTFKYNRHVLNISTLQFATSAFQPWQHLGGGGSLSSS